MSLSTRTRVAILAIIATGVITTFAIPASACTTPLVYTETEAGPRTRLYQRHRWAVITRLFNVIKFTHKKFLTSRKGCFTTPYHSYKGNRSRSFSVKQANHFATAAHTFYTSNSSNVKHSRINISTACWFFFFSVNKDMVIYFSYFLPHALKFSPNYETNAFYRTSMLVQRDYLLGIHP